MSYTDLHSPASHLVAMLARERLLGGFDLGGSHVEPLTGTVTGPAGTVHLAPKAMEVLLRLAQTPLSTVARDDLLRSVWGSDSAAPEKLVHAISEIRHAFADRPTDPLLVQTMPKRGYRLLLAPDVRLEAGEPIVPASGTGLIGELKRRGVLETGLAYLIVGWLLIQIADVTFDQLSLPRWASVFVTYLVIVGFPVALVLAWFIELTPQGVVLDRDPAGRPARQPFSKSYKAILGALVVASAGVFVYDRTIGLPGDRALEDTVERAEAAVAVDPSSIAVLPFLNIGDDDRARVFATGLADDVINRLTRIPGLRVASRGDSFSLEPNSASRDVRRRLRVAYYLEGSVRVMSNTLRVVVQLIDSETGFHMVSRSFDHELEDFFAVQDEITSLTVANLRVALPATTQAVEAATSATDLDAYLLYSMGMQSLYEPRTAATIESALDSFRQALRRDPEYAAAHAGICMSYASGYRVVNDTTYIDAAEAACSRALELNANLDVVHDALGELYFETGRYEDAEASYERALDINVNRASSLIGLGRVYQRQQRLAEAENRFEQAVELQPGSWDAYNALGSFFFNNGRYPEAARAYREVIALGIDNMNGWNNLGAALTLSGQFGEAASAYRQSIRIQATQTAYANLGLLHYYLGEVDAAVDALEQAVEMAPTDYSSWSNLGDVLSYSQTPQRAREAFLRAEELAEERLRVNNRDAETTVDLAWIKAVLGKPAEASELARRALSDAAGNPHIHYINALIFARSRDSSAALDELETAIGMGYPRLLIAAEPHLRSLNDEPRFLRLTEQRGP